MKERERARLAAVNAAIDFVKSLGKDIILGLGTGSTSALFIKTLPSRIERSSIRLVIPSSYQSEEAAIEAGFQCGPLREGTRPHVYVDSFDQCDVGGNVIKGGGAALAREKVLLGAAREPLLIGEVDKLVDVLNMPVPIEVLPFAARSILEGFRASGYRASIRQSAGKAGPVVTDNGNLLLDVELGEISSPEEVERRIKLMPGVVEVGVCPRRRHKVFIGMRDGSVKAIG